MAPHNDGTGAEMDATSVRAWSEVWGRAKGLAAALLVAGTFGLLSACAPPDLTLLNADGGAIVAKKDRKSTRLNSSHTDISRMPSSA